MIVKKKKEGKYERVQVEEKGANKVCGFSLHMMVDASVVSCCFCCRAYATGRG